MNFPGFEIIKNGSQPQTLKWALEPLYKYNQRGSLMYWQIGFDPYTNQLITRHGQVQKADGTRGEIKENKKTVKLNRTGRNYQQQAYLEANRKFVNQHKKNYRRDGESFSSRPMPQLAKNYVPPINRKTAQPQKTNITHKQLVIGVSCQPKLDGIRALSWKQEDGSIIMISRLNNEFTSPVHIKTQLFYFFPYVQASIKHYLPNYTEEFGIDGEMYNPDIIFEKTVSIIKNEVNLSAEIVLLKYYIFDVIILKVPTETRMAILSLAYTWFVQTEYYKGILMVLTSTTVYSYQDIDKLHDHYVRLGFEGLMIRNLAGSNQNQSDSYYKPERNTNLLKYKVFSDNEGIVVDIVSGEGKEEELAIMRVKDNYGRIFGVRPRGSYESRKNIYENKDKYIGLPYTYRYFELTDKGIPRFPVGITFRSYE